MNDVVLKFDKIDYSFPFVFVEGTGNKTFLFGLENDQLKVSMKDFYISKYLVTQILWQHIMGSNPSFNMDDNKPVTNISYNDIVDQNGFLQKLPAAIKNDISMQLQSNTFQFRLPSETEWEYAARGGIYWGNYFLFSGSDNIDEIGWYKHNSNNESKVVGLKKSNQLGIFDMCGNVWEWCADYFQRDTKKIPLNGSACAAESNERVLRGGCFHNSGIHCTVMKRYEITPEAKDECIGFRLVLSN